MNYKIEEMQKQINEMLQSFETLKNTTVSDEIETTLYNLKCIEQEWKNTLNKLKEHEKEYSQLIGEVKFLRDSIKK